MELERQMVYQRGNQREGTSHYVFLYSDEENGGEEDSIPLQPRSRNASIPRKIEVLNVQLGSDDTLQALAVRYRCTISELKRINKIHKENEIYARRHIKVPVQPFSILTETLDQSQDANEGQSDVAIPNLEEPSTSSEKAVQLLDLKSLPSGTESPTAEINTIILNSVCEPLSSYNNASFVETSNTDTDQLLPTSESNTPNAHLTDRLKCSGDDCGLTWTQLVGFSLLLVVAGTIIYILHISEISHLTLNH